MYSKTFIIIAAGTLLAGNVSAAVYKTVDEQGNVIYTDEPAGNGEPIKLPPLSTVPPPNYQPSTPAGSSSNVAAAGQYEKLAIITPSQDETVRDNTGNINVRVAIKPNLNKAAGHRLQYFLDGQKEGEPSSSDQAVYTNVDRGAHTVEVAVVDTAGKVLQRSPGSRFYLHRQSTNFPKGPASPTPLGGR